MAGLYIHIPFCKQACSYCDFYFSTRQQLREPFLQALLNEIRSYIERDCSLITWNTLYLGGGTPSLLDERELNQILETIREVFVTDFQEVTMELNPDDVSEEYLKQIQHSGVNRASMGIQSFQPELLRFMHRAHTAEEAIHALDALKETGFPAFTADLIYGNPGQSEEMLEQDIEQLLQFNPPHISAYSLTIEPRTRLGRQFELGRLNPADDELVAAHHTLLRERLSEAGLQQYEVSNYALKGKRSLHNSSYWTHQPYLGFGPSAHSFMPGDRSARRWKNRPDLRSYITASADLSHVEAEVLDLPKLAEERLMLGLRTTDGVSLSELAQRYEYRFSESQIQWIEQQQQKGMIEFDSESISFTASGLLIADYLTVELISRHTRKS